MLPLIQALIDRYRCPVHYLRLQLTQPLSRDDGYFRFGPDIICYGCSSRGFRSSTVNAELYDVRSDVVALQNSVEVPFDPTELIDNLRMERYATSQSGTGGLGTLAKSAYYSLRPFMPTNLRRRVQRAYFNRWKKLKFPAWPVDRTVESLSDELLSLLIRHQNLERIPVIWFWPDGASSCAIVTHDVETTAGRDFCGSLMDLDDRFRIKSSFQIVPEKRYEVTPSFTDGIWSRGFEVVVHDLNHDGRLFQDRREFLSRAEKINAYGKMFGASGFRSAVLYRNQSWFGDLKFSYDMSVPNVAHLDAQRGGCCTVMPYFIGDILELPVTMTQDYSLFHMMHDFTLDLWKRQAELIMEAHGLMSFIVHPDYIIQQRERNVYESLLGYLSELRNDRGVWIATPGEVSRWWRQRNEMSIVEGSDGARIEGPGSERARIAYASQCNGKLVFTMGPTKPLA